MVLTRGRRCRYLAITGKSGLDHLFGHIWPQQTRLVEHILYKKNIFTHLVFASKDIAVWLFDLVCIKLQDGSREIQSHPHRLRFMFSLKVPMV